MFTLKERFLVDENGTRTAVVLDIEDYYKLLDKLEELDDIQAYDAAKATNGDPIPFEQAASEIQAQGDTSPQNGSLPEGVGELMTFEEMRSRFEGEWVIVGEPELTPSLMIIRGTIVWHGVDTDELYQKRRELGFANIVHWYFPSKSRSTERILAL